MMCQKRFFVNNIRQPLANAVKYPVFSFNETYRLCITHVVNVGISIIIKKIPTTRKMESVEITAVTISRGYKIKIESNAKINTRPICFFNASNSSPDVKFLFPVFSTKCKYTIGYAMHATEKRMVITTPIVTKKINEKRLSWKYVVKATELV